MTHDQKICYEHGKTCCRVQICLLSNKMRTCKPGESVGLKPFLAHDGKTQFRLTVYPNGNREENSGHISIILESISDELIYCDYEVKLSSYKLDKSIGNFTVSSKQSKKA